MFLWKVLQRKDLTVLCSVILSLDDTVFLLIYGNAHVPLSPPGPASHQLSYVQYISFEDSVEGLEILVTTGPGYVNQW